MAAEPLRKPTYSSLDKGKDQDKTRDQMTEVMLVQKTGNEREEEHFFREKKNLQSSVGWKSGDTCSSQSDRTIRRHTAVWLAHQQDEPPPPPSSTLGPARRALSGSH